MKKWLLQLMLAYVLVECTGYFLSALNIEPTGFKLYVNNEWNNNQNPYADRDTTVGVWHTPNDEWVQSGPCFTVKMNSNQFGARDNVWDTTKKGYLFLGSSFIEGYGMRYGKRISEVFEQLTHKEVFNCAMSGTFTPVQYYATLQKFTGKLKFDTCFVFFVLPNDEYHISKTEEGRYRPYLSDTGIYYVKSTAYFPEKKSAKDKLQLFVQQYSYVYHLYYYFQNRNILKSRILDENGTAPQEKYTNLSAVMHLFCSHYPDKFFYFVMLPTLSYSPANIPTAPDANMRIVDLRNCLDMHTDYYECNSHWNENGHAKTAKALYDTVLGQPMDKRYLSKSK